MYFTDKNFEKIKPQLCNLGYEVIYREDLIHFNSPDSKYYQAENDSHPSDKAWDAIVPKLIKYLK